MSVDACAALVQRGDPDRFMSAMTAPPHLRGRLMVLYAFNLEIARAAWVTSEPMIAEMRLQWWLDMVTEIREGRP
ncbi:MAG: squalene/phytoene synthase family protein, partial [Alphaproteobacteria bacterium]|nr:squalene/phytoene synthase family protein [Alphaproteobacteria bacterium]